MKRWGHSSLDLENQSNILWFLNFYKITGVPRSFGVPHKWWGIGRWRMRLALQWSRLRRISRISLNILAYYSYVNLIMDRMKINLSKTYTLRFSQHVINFKFHSMRWLWLGLGSKLTHRIYESWPSLALHVISLDLILIESCAKSLNPSQRSQRSLQASNKYYI